MRRVLILTLAAGLAFTATANAGSFILDLTDADDHGGVSSGANIDGWLYMQRVLENLAPGVTNGNTTVVQIGASAGEASTAAASAFNLSSLAGAGGWTYETVDGATDIGTFFAGTNATVNLADAGILMFDSGSNVGGGITSAELTVVNANATAIDNFLGAGGGLHSMAQAGTGQYGWLSTLLPGLTFTGFGSNGLTLTVAGSAAFPGLTNGDLSAGPFHGWWTGGTGGLTTLFVDNDIGTTYGGFAVGIGSSGGSVTAPSAVPLPSAAWAGLGMLALLGLRRRLQRQNAA